MLVKNSGYTTCCSNINAVGLLSSQNSTPSSTPRSSTPTTEVSRKSSLPNRFGNLGNLSPQKPARKNKQIGTSSIPASVVSSIQRTFSNSPKMMRSLIQNATQEAVSSPNTQQKLAKIAGKIRSRQDVPPENAEMNRGRPRNRFLFKSAG
ncbi:unnamed protein product [Oikopleura dioica]|uniref:Uncharacterized protein n=1 Tax=Oikopleura dioica TaxID=34765 RepID=E4XQQ0_OIKDI|nr:unnamed protein product [Oikopleura dioica]